MKSDFLFILVLCLATAPCYSASLTAPPAVQWQQTIGGASYDQPITLTETPDGGFVFAGTSISGISGNKTSLSHDTNLWNGDYYQLNAGDYWLVKLDAKGRKQWDHSFGFGNLDSCWNLQQLPDGGFILGGSSVISNRVDPILGLIGESDTWLVRTDHRGKEVWDYRFSDAGLDYPLSMVPMAGGELLVVGSQTLAWLDRFGDRIDRQLSMYFQEALFANAQRTADGGLLLVGSWANPAVITNQGRFQESGLTDVWLGRFSADGHKLWEKTYGGVLSEFGSSTYEYPDGSFMILATSDSPPDENKTAPLRDGPNPDPFFGLFQGDVWVFRIDADGNKLWDRSFGIEQFDWPGVLQPASDGGAFLFWWSITPDFAQTFLHLTRIDHSGNEQWVRTFESGVDFRKAVEMPDGGVLLGGTAPTGTNALKIELGYGTNDCWLLRLDAAGNRLWDMALGGSGDDGLQSLERTKDGGFILCIVSSSGTDGNKTTPNYGDYDLWAVKLGPEQPLDSDGDGVPDDRDECPNTPPHAIVNADGCSIAQLVPCDGQWKNHGQYVRAIVKVTGQFRKAGLISHEQRLGSFLRAVRSECGKNFLEKSSKSIERKKRA